VRGGPAKGQNWTLHIVNISVLTRQKKRTGEKELGSQKKSQDTSGKRQRETDKHPGEQRVGG